jgi:hypothetical protein
VIAGLKHLRDCGLVTRISHHGSAPNVYEVPFAVSRQSTSQPEDPAPPITSVRELAAACFRPLTDQEFTQLTCALPDEAVLRHKLELLKRQGGVEPDLSIGFLTRVLKEHV